MRLLALLLLAACGSQSTRHVNTTDAIALRERLRAQSFVCTEGYYKGFPCNDKTYRGVPHNDWGDSILYTNLLCLSGDSQYCLKPRFEDVDSRDTSLGLAAYLIATKDISTAKQFSDYFKTKPNRICFDECSRTRTIEDLLARSGIEGMRRLGSGIIEAELLTEANTAPEGYQLRLVADKLFIYSKLGIHMTSNIGKTLYRRQSCSPYFRWFAFGSYDARQLDIKGKNKVWRFSPSCADVRIEDSNGWSEILLINMTLTGNR
jgi:hypothetical protein